MRHEHEIDYFAIVRPATKAGRISQVRITPNGHFYNHRKAVDDCRRWTKGVKYPVKLTVYRDGTYISQVVEDEEE